MRFFYKGKDGGALSNSTGFWLIEIKQLFSVLILKMEGESREVFHTHAFNAVSFLLSGRLREEFIVGSPRHYSPSILPIYTGRIPFHRVSAEGTAYVLSFRGPWHKDWMELGKEGFTRLGWGRQKIK